MFDQLKDLYKLRQQAGQLQTQLANEKVTGKSTDGRFSVVMSGNQEVLEVFVPTEELKKNEVEQGMKEAFHDARTKIEAILKSKVGGIMGL